MKPKTLLSTSLLFLSLCLVLTSASLSHAGTCISSANMDFSVGWNLVGFKGDIPIGIANAQQLIVALSADGVIASHAANWTGSSWEIYQYGLPFNNFALEPLKGYMVRCTQGGSWSFDVYVADCVTLTPTNTPIPTITPTTIAGHLYSTDNIVGNMRYVPAGSFTQGSPGGEACRDSDESQFNHILTRNLAVMETEITRQMWADLKAAQSTLPNDPTYTSYGSGMTNPVQNNTWYESILFANLLSVENGLTPCYYTDSGFTSPITSSNYTTGPFYCNFDADGYRLLTEGEWEYAARAGTTGPFSCDEPDYDVTICTMCDSPGMLAVLEQHAVFCMNDANRSEPVGSKLANPWNLKDMHGNVWEWCWDWYSSSYPGDTTDYEGAGSGSFRVFRGGSWYRSAYYCRSADRRSSGPVGRYDDVGFRFARTL